MMKRLKITDIEKGRIFRNNTLEVFSKTNLSIIIGFYLLVWCTFIVLNQYFASLKWVQALIIYCTAMFLWTFFEYIIHRFVFHFINNSQWAKRFHYTIHGVHHQYPRDEERLIMPPLPGFLILSLFTGIVYLIINKAAFVFMAGFLNGWAIYVSIHYVVHVYQPVKPFKVLWTHHAKHHYQSEKRAYGVSSPLWDYIFGTMPE